ncbi:histone acetyltransferase HAC12 [Prunus yedoensis var. nudiflora]|uniref:Histone acetyltransferase HAC12 n=1 Tax=Prunus yedoensis var. nudiflora TaxID=2094558 RepID=A0A314ZIR3_PRUYE|nr:histone acetyltransferase HAC12 [Prunus yedoensis var. nudiflora]
MDVQRYNSDQTFGHISNYPVLNSSPFLLGRDGLRRQSIKCQPGYLSDWRKGPRVSSVRNLFYIFFLSTNYVLGELASDFVGVLENQLFMEATSEEEYVNEETLSHRLQILLQHKLYDANSNEQVGLPLCTPMPTSGLPHGCCDSANNADHVNFIKGSPFNGYKQGYANRFIASNELDMPFSSGLMQVASEIFLPLEDASASITAYSNANEFLLLEVLMMGHSLLKGNMNYSSDISIDCHVQQQHLDHGRLGNAQSMVFPSTVGEFSAVSSSNLLIPQHIPIEVPEVSNILPGTIFSKEISTLEDIVQSCSLIMKSQHNQNRPRPSYLQPRVPPEQSHAAQQCASDGPSSGNIEDILPSSKRLKMENKNGSFHLLAPSVVQNCAPEGLSYLQHQSESPLSINSEDTVQSCSRMIKSQHNQKRPPRPYLRPQVPPEQSHGAQEYASDGPSSGNIEDIPPSSKRLKMENKIEGSHLLAPSVIQHCAHEGLPYLQHQSESPLSINSEDVVQSCSQMIKSQHNQKRPLHPYLQPQVPPGQSNGAQEYASDGPSSGNIEDMPPSSKRSKMENINENSHLLAPSVVQPCAPKGLSYLQQQSKSPVSINSEVTHVEIEPVKNSIQDSTGISDVRKCDSDNIINWIPKVCLFLLEEFYLSTDGAIRPY